MPQSILVTGAAGFAGSHLIDLLAGHDAEVIGWDRPGSNRPHSTGASWQLIDLLDRSRVRAALGEIRPTAVYHCAGAAHVGQSWDHAEMTFASNVLGTHNLIEGLRANAIEASVLIPSSAMVYAAADRPLRETDPLLPASPYAVSKLAQERVGLADRDGLRVIVARSFNHIGPRQSPSIAASGLARCIADIEAGRRNAELEVGNLDAKRDLTDVRDTVRAYQLLVEQAADGGIYNVCSGRPVTIRHVVDMLISRARVPVRVTIDPTRYRPHDAPMVVGDLTKISAELGWTPRIPLEQTIDDLLDYWRHQ